MKRSNYYEVHKNKKPKRLLRKKPNLLVLKSAIISMQSFAQHAIIVSQNFNSMTEKSIAVFENVKKHAEALSDLYKINKPQRYLSRNVAS
jgi:hypothetical protein